MKIEIKNLTKKFKNNNILTDINLEFESGSIYGIIGRNGSGKTVLLKMICGFYNPTSGEITYDGVNVMKKGEFPPSTRALIENPTFLPDLTGVENLKLLASIQNTIGIDEINNTLDLVKLSSEDRNKNYSTYSLGMKQKLGIAQVLMENPQVIILDEPLNGIEDATAKEIRVILEEEKNKGKLIIIASHIKEDIESIADVVYKVDGGMIEKTEEEL